MAATGKYIYGIVPNFYSTDMFRLLENTGVYAIPFQNISAIVSDVEIEHLDYSNKESLVQQLITHQKNIEKIIAIGFNMVLPMKLGTIVGSKEEVAKILNCGKDLIVKSLEEIEYLTEIDVAVTWADFPETLMSIANHPEIKALKEDVLNSDTTITKIDQVKVGMLIQEKLEKNNKIVELKIIDSLSPLVADINMHEVMNDQMITNSAFLINRSNTEKFEMVIEQIDEEFNGTLNFKLVGPLPCYSFYTIEVDVLDPNKIDQAKNDLGLGEFTMENEIKKAYLEKARMFHPDTNFNNDDKENFDQINKAYHILLNYCASFRQYSKEDLISLKKETVIENLILVKIRK